MTVRGFRCVWALAGLLGSGGCIAQSLEKAGLQSEEGETGSTTFSTDGGSTVGGSGPLGGDSSTGLGQSGTTTLGDAETTGGESDAAEGGPYGGACCRANGTPGCDEDPGVDACVCDVDPYCCEEEWDEVCADLAQDLGCLDCEGPDTKGTELPGDCCSPTQAAGCLDADVEACVCEADPFCCEVEWDEACVDDTSLYECGCAEPPGTTDGGTDTGGPSDCCDASVEPGCVDPGIEACVCALDNFCCETSWDQQCTGLVNEGGCGMCSYPPGTGDCCEENATIGCDDPDIQDCVCVGDPFCCTIEWDGICVLQVDELMCGMCPVDTFGSTGPDGMTEPGTTGSTGM